MRAKFKKFGCYVIIIILLPYVVTVFLNGPSITSYSHVDETYVKVKVADASGDEAAGGDATAGTVVEMPIEEYCVGMLAKEIPASYEEEALKAQAILVRTDVYKKINESGSDTVLEDDFWTQKQMEKAWGGKYSKYYHKLEKVWSETEGQVLNYGDTLALTPFFRLSNGWTRDAKEVLESEDYPYLKIVECPEDIEAEKQLQTVTVDDMDVEITATDTAGYVLNVRVGQENVSGEEFRNTYKLASGCFTIQRCNGQIRITTRGIGHGLGLSQYEANQMAKNGKTYEEILQYFFEGTEIKEVAEILLDTE
ncbi:MAG: SpoIID/LytB domain-containing protein [Lachnospiraceae bacterium]|nr:SpoIID/LytB domain-containing protein [Lachnospiraceae bacterium]